MSKAGNENSLVEVEEALPSERVVLPQKETDALMVLIQGAVLNPEINTDVVEKLWEMQKESQDRDAKAAFAKAKAKAMRGMPASIGANQENKHTHSTYSDLSAVNTEVVPVYAKAGFSLSFNTGPSDLEHGLKIMATLTHEQGHTEEYSMDMPIDDVGSGGTTNKTQIQARASSTQYGQRYLVCMIWNIATGHDQDGNSVAPKQAPRPQYVTITEEQAIKLHATVNDHFVESRGAEGAKKTADSWMKELCAWAGPDIKMLSHMPADRFDSAMALIQERIRKVSEAKEQTNGNS